MQATSENRRQEGGLGEHLSTMYRMLCPYRVYSSCQKEGTGENRSRLAYCRAFFGLLIHQNHLRKFDFRE